MNIKIDYDGKYPCLCMGNLKVTIDEKIWQFPDYCLSSGGTVTFDEKWNEIITYGSWEVSKWPKDFPEELKSDVILAINSQIDEGCCGGCV